MEGEAIRGGGEGEGGGNGGWGTACSRILVFVRFGFQVACLRFVFS